MGPVDDEPGWLKALWWASILFLWVGAAIVVLACVFGLVLINW